MIFAPFVLDASGSLLLTREHGRKIPHVDIDAQPTFTCTVVPVPDSEHLGFQFLVRFNVNGNPVATVRQKDVEKVYCPSPTPGTAQVAMLDGNRPRDVPHGLPRPHPWDRRRHPRSGRLTTVTTTDQGAVRHVVVMGGSIAGLLASRVSGRPRGQSHRP